MLETLREKIWTLGPPSSSTIDLENSAKQKKKKKTIDLEKLSINAPETSPTTERETWSQVHGGRYHIHYCIYGTFIAGFEGTVLRYLFASPLRSLGVMPELIFIPHVFYLIFHGMALWDLCRRNLAVPHTCLGAVGKLVVEVINFFVMMVLRQFLNLHFFFLFMFFTAELQVIARLKHVAYDIGVWDVLLGLLMQLLLYATCGYLYWSAAVCLAFGALTLFRYKSYAPPVIPIDSKKEEDYSPC